MTGHVQGHMQHVSGWYHVVSYVNVPLVSAMPISCVRANLTF